MTFLGVFLRSHNTKMLLEKTLSTTQYVVKNSHQVRINKEAILKIAKKIAKKPRPLWANIFHFQGNTEQTAQYIFILDSLNFCFWANKGKERWTIKNGSKTINGYFALALTLKNSFKKYPLSNAMFLADIKRQTLKEIFASCNSQTIPLFEERYQIIRQIGQVLSKKHQGQAANLIKQAENSAQKLVEIVVRNFSSFRDTAVYQGKKIYLLKRAQLLASDLWGAFKGQGLGRFNDIEKLTCFADYKIPQILYYFDVLEYSDKLLLKIKNEKLIPAGSQEEIEIRANTIWAVEEIKQTLSAQGYGLPSFQIDWLLWNLAQKIKMPTAYHKTRTIYY